MSRLLQLIFLLLVNVSVFAQDTTRVPVTDTTVSNYNPPLPSPRGVKHNLSSVKDGNGGTFLIWETFSTADTSSTSGIYAQHLNAAGDAIWTSPLKLVNSGGFVNPKITSDKNGGFIVAWTDFSWSSSDTSLVNNYNIYAQRVNSAGSKLWGPRGTLISNSRSFQYIESISGFGSAGAIIAWTGAGSRLAVVNGDGTIAQSILISTNPHSGIGSVFEERGGGLSVIYSTSTPISGDSLFVHHAYLQRYTSSGTPLFSNEGINFLSASDVDQDIEIEEIVLDGAGGVYLLIYDDINHKLYLQHVSSTGELTFGTPYGKVVDESSVGDMIMFSDNAGGVIVGWTDIRSSQISSVKNSASTSTVVTTPGFYAQRFNSAGTKLWANDVAIKTSGISEDGELAGLTDDSGNFIFVFPGNTSSGYSIYAQKLNASGAAQWPSSGVLVDDSPGDKSDLTLSVSNNTLTIVYSQSTASNTNIYSQVINPNGTVLPVTLSSFNAVVKNANVELNWKTASETNNAYFEVLRSEDQKSFTSVARIKGKGNSKAESAYSYIDAIPVTNADYLYYRLKQVDNNGTSTLSYVEAVKIPKLSEGTVSVYPNPVTDFVQVSVNSRVNDMSIQVLDVAGRVLISKNLSANTAKIDLTSLSSGVYVLQITGAGERFSRKLVK